MILVTFLISFLIFFKLFWVINKPKDEVVSCPPHKWVWGDGGYGCAKCHFIAGTHNTKNGEY